MSAANSDAMVAGLRDILAGHIITGLLTAPARPGVPLLTRNEMAFAAYELADEMIKARAS